ncbi:MAG TPA: ParA family protein [Thermoanaerobaculia bacterium]|nr:ParA family protein [Thermoanaerobaculia bacterium]
MPTRILAIVNQKGGVGKTTTAVSLAAGLAALGRHVLLVDCDPQSAASRWLGFAKQPGQAFLEDVLAGRAPLPAAIYPTAVPRLSLLPASPELAVQARLLAVELAGETVLALRLRRELPAGFDYVLLDAPPELGMLSVNALVAASELVIPVTLDPLATEVLDQLLDTIDRVRERLNPELRIAGILAVRVNGHTLLAREVLARLAARFPDLLYPLSIRQTVRAAEAPGRQRSLLDHHPDSSAAQDYRALAALLVGQEVRA